MDRHVLKFIKQHILGMHSLFVNYTTIPRGGGAKKTLDLAKPGFAISVFSNSINLSKLLRTSAFIFCLN